MIGQLFLGDDLLPWLLLAFGAALVVGNLVAVIRPPMDESGTARRERPDLVRVVAMVVLGAVVAVWAAVSLAG